jgi:hypothetical protein
MLQEKLLILELIFTLLKEIVSIPKNIHCRHALYGAIP